MCRQFLDFLPFASVGSGGTQSCKHWQSLDCDNHPEIQYKIKLCGWFTSVQLFTLTVSDFLFHSCAEWTPVCSSEVPGHTCWAFKVFNGRLWILWVHSWCCLCFQKITWSILSCLNIVSPSDHSTSLDWYVIDNLINLVSLMKNNIWTTEGSGELWK